MSWERSLPGLATGLIKCSYLSTELIKFSGLATGLMKFPGLATGLIKFPFLATGLIKFSGLATGLIKFPGLATGLVNRPVAAYVLENPFCTVKWSPHILPYTCKYLGCANMQHWMLTANCRQQVGRESLDSHVPTIEIHMV